MAGKERSEFHKQVSQAGNDLFFFAKKKEKKNRFWSSPVRHRPLDKAPTQQRKNNIHTMAGKDK